MCTGSIIAIRTDKSNVCDGWGAFILEGGVEATHHDAACKQSIAPLPNTQGISAFSRRAFVLQRANSPAAFIKPSHKNGMLQAISKHGGHSNVR